MIIQLLQTLIPAICTYNQFQTQFLSRNKYLLMSYTYLFKYIIIGDSGVGKSCLLMRYANKQYRQKHQVTIGVQYGTRMLNLNQNIVKLQIWDTAGQQCYRSIIRGYYRNSIGTILCYDTTSKESFINIQKWVDQVKQTAPSKMRIILVGTKSDQNSERKVSFENAEKYAKENDMLFIECSSKSNKNIDTIFQLLTELILERMQKNQIEVKNQPGIKIGNMPHIKGTNSSSLSEQNLNYDKLKLKRLVNFPRNIWGSCLSFLNFN